MRASILVWCGVALLIGWFVVSAVDMLDVITARVNAVSVRPDVLGRIR